MSGPLGGRTLAARSLRAFSGVIGMIAVVTLAMALLTTILPRAIDGFLSDGVRYDVDRASPLSRDISAERDGRLVYGPGVAGGMSPESQAVWGAVDEALEAIRDELPQPLRDTMRPADYTVFTAPQVSEREGDPRASLGLAYAPRYLSHIEMLEGEAPTTAPSAIPSGRPIEVVASTAVAERLSWQVGETRTMFLADRLQQDVVLSGIFEAVDASEDYWTRTPSTIEPTVFSRSLPPEINATVFVDPAGVDAAVESVLTTRSTVVFPLDADRLDSADMGDLAQQVREFTSVTRTLEAGVTLPFQSDLPALLESAERRNGSSQAILATILAGPLGLLVAIELLVARLVVFRLRPSLDLLSARGASPTQRRLLLAAPAALVGAVCTGAGLAAGLLLPGGRLGVVGTVAVVAVALAPALMLVLVGATTDSRRVSPATAARLRFAAEAVLLVATSAAIVTLATRGVEAAVPGGVGVLAAATPLLVSLVGCAVALRLYPLLLRRFRRRATRATGLSPLLGMARALRAGSAGFVPLVAVVVGVSVAVFSGVLSATLASGLQSASRAEVGASLSVDEVRLDPAEVDAVRDVDGVEAVAAVSSDAFHYVVPEGGKRIAVTALLVDPVELAAVQRDWPGALRVPDSFGQTGAAPVAIIVSEAVAERSLGVTTAELDGRDVEYVGSAQYAPFFDTRPSWIVLDRANAEAVGYALPSIARQLLVRLKPGASAEAVALDIRAVVGAGAVFSDPVTVAAGHSANPAVGGIRSAVLIAIGGSMLSSAAALTLTAALDARSRRRSISLLATLGLSRRQGRSSVAWELAPLSVVGLVAGALLGAALSAVILTTVDLRPFTAGVEQPAIIVDPILTAGTLLGFALVLVATGAASTLHAVARPRSRPAAPGNEGWTP